MAEYHQENGRRGGEETLRKYGRGHFVDLGRIGGRLGGRPTIRSILEREAEARKRNRGRARRTSPALLF